MTVEKLITDHIDSWSSALKIRSTAGRGSNGKIDLYGIKKLRELILELAVRGKLVPQDPNDEPASELLKRIAAEKAELVKLGRIKKQKPLPEISEDEKPFELPLGWEWCRFASLPTMYSTGLDRGKSQQSSENQFKYFKMNNILNNGGFDLTDVTRVNATQHEVELYSLRDNDFLFNTRNSKELVGKTCVFISTRNETVLYNNNILRSVFLEGILSYQIDIWMRSSSGKTELEKIKSGTTNVWAIYQGKLELLCCLVPPLAEQYRIVAKVDELMLLCDHLEQQSLASLDAHQQMVETLLASLTSSKSAEELAENWARISQHFDTLFTTEASIDALKQTILQLAVMGKLVPQDPKDEPASELLKRIEQEKAQLVKEGKIKKQKPLPQVSDEEKPFELPEGWEWCRLGALFSFQNGYAFKSEWFSDNGIRLVRNANISHGFIKWSDSVSLPESMLSAFRDFSLNKGDVVISLDRPIINTGLKYAFIRECDLPCLLLQRVAKFSSFGNIISSGFLSKWLESNYFINAIDPGRSNGVPHISTKQLEMTLFPLLSHNEQNKIIMKTNELMEVCDHLKSRLQSAQQTQLHLADALTDAALS